MGSACLAWTQILTVGEDLGRDGRQARDGPRRHQDGVDDDGLEAQEDERQLEGDDLGRVVELLQLPEGRLESHDEGPQTEEEGGGRHQVDVDVGVVGPHVHVGVPVGKA